MARILGSKELVFYGLRFTEATTDNEKWIEIAEREGGVYSLQAFMLKVNNEGLGTPEYIYKAFLIDNDNPEATPVDVREINEETYTLLSIFPV